jgi:YHS domain-containing protein
MVLRLALFIVLAILVARAFWRTVDGIVEGFTGGRVRRDGVPQRNGEARSVQMVRDPVCGTFVVPDRAIVVRDGARQVYFCSAACRDKYAARTA